MDLRLKLINSGRIFLYTLYTIACLISAQTWADTKCAEPPEEWRNYLQLEQDYNVPDRAPLPEDVKKTQEVYEFKIYKGDGIQEFSRSNPRAPQESANLYIAQSWTESMPYLFNKTIIPPKRVLCGQRVQGHSTVFVWDPEGLTKPFFVKTKEIVGITRVARLFEKALKKSKAPNIGFLPETSFTEIKRIKSTQNFFTYKESSFKINSLRRETEPSPRSRNKEVELMPLHGFLGSHLIDEAARTKGISREEWVKQFYLPMLANYFASLHFEIKFMHASHTQNLLFEFDATKGEIARFIIRDLHDLYPDYFKLIVDKSIFIPQSFYHRRMNGYGYDYGVKNLTAEQLSMPGVHFGSYSMQSVIAPARNNAEKIIFSEEFLRLYAEQVEKRYGKKIVYSESAQSAWEWLKEKEFYSRNLKSKYATKQGFLNATFTEIVGSIHQFVADETAPRLSGPFDPAPQMALRYVFNRLRNARFYANAAVFAKYHRKNVPSTWRFKLEDDRIFAADETGRIVSVTALRLDNELKSKLNGLIRAAKAGRCEYLLMTIGF